MSKSCGCQKGNDAKKRFTTHGLRQHKLWTTWNHIKNRCYNPNRQFYKHYGGRGIKVYEAWINDMKAFYDYVTVLPNYDEDNLGLNGLTLDRINNDGNYEPGNLRWTDMHTQAVNRRNTQTGTSAFTGVSKSGGRWCSYIKLHGNMINIGRYDSEIEAASARYLYIKKHGLCEYAIQQT
jgi:hypothetical protein